MGAKGTLKDVVLDPEPEANGWASEGRGPWEGARGDVAAEMAGVFGLRPRLPLPKFLPAFEAPGAPGFMDT